MIKLNTTNQLRSSRSYWMHKMYHQIFLLKKEPQKNSKTKACSLNKTTQPLQTLGRTISIKTLTRHSTGVHARQKSKTLTKLLEKQSSKPLEVQVQMTIRLRIKGMGFWWEADTF